MSNVTNHNKSIFCYSDGSIIKIILLMFFVVFHSFFIVSSNDNPTVCTITFNGSCQPIAIVKSWLNGLDYLKDLTIETNDYRPGCPINIEAPLSGEHSCVTNLMVGLFLPMLSFIKKKSLRNASSYNLLLICIRKIQEKQRMWGWDYHDLKNGTIISGLLFAPRVLERAFANCCYDQWPHYFDTIKQKRLHDCKSIVQKENDFIQGTIINQKLLVSLYDLPHEQNNRINVFFEGTLIACYFYFQHKGLRTLDGIDCFMKEHISIITPNQNFNFNDNFIQEIDALSDPSNKQLYEIFRDNKIFLHDNPLSEKALKFCRENRLEY
jgi:hypothetical protein